MATGDDEEIWMTSRNRDGNPPKDHGSNDERADRGTENANGPSRSGEDRGKGRGDIPRSPRRGDEKEPTGTHSTGPRNPEP